MTRTIPLLGAKSGLYIPNGRNIETIMEYSGRMIIIHAVIPLHGKQQPVAIMVDTGCSNSCMSQASANALRVPKRRLQRPKYAMIADGSRCRITHFTTLDIVVGPFTSQWKFDITPGTLGAEDFLLGLDWLTKYNPKISCKSPRKPLLVFQHLSCNSVADCSRVMS